MLQGILGVGKDIAMTGPSGFFKVGTTVFWPDMFLATFLIVFYQPRSNLLTVDQPGCDFTLLMALLLAGIHARSIVCKKNSMDGRHPRFKRETYSLTHRKATKIIAQLKTVFHNVFSVELAIYCISANTCG